MEIATVPKARGAKNWWLLVVAKVKIGDLSQEKWWVNTSYSRCIDFFTPIVGGDM